MRSTENLLQRMLKTEEGIIILVSGFLLILAFVKKFEFLRFGDFFDIFKRCARLLNFTTLEFAMCGPHVYFSCTFSTLSSA